MTFTFTEEEKDLIVLGVNQITRVLDGITTTYTINNFGSNSYVYNIIRERIANNGELDINILYAENAIILQTKYPQVYQLYTQSSTQSQTITATTAYSV